MVSDRSWKPPKGATCSNNTHIYTVFSGPAWGAWGGPNGKRTKNRATGTKHITQRGPFWSAFMEKKWYFRLKMLCVDIENCASCIGGEHIFPKNMKKRPESEKRSREGLDGKLNVYMRGLGAAEKRICWKSACLTTLFATVTPEPPSSRAARGGGRLVWRFWEVWRVWNLAHRIYTPRGQRPRRIFHQIFSRC